MPDGMAEAQVRFPTVPVGLEVSDRGRIPADVRRRDEAAHGG